MARIQLRRDAAADWTSADPTLSAGEFGYETDTGKLKVGDGTTAWTALGYLETSGGSATAKNSVEDDAGDLQLVGDTAAPGNNKVYGTSATGTRGWKDNPLPIRWTSGYWYTPAGRGTTQSAGSSRLYFMPLWIPPGASIDRIGCEVTTGEVDAEARLGVYADSGGGLPGDLLFDAGLVDATVADHLEITLSPAEVLPDDTLVWLALASATAGGATFRAITDRQIGVAGTNLLVQSIGASNSGYFQIIDASAGLPASAGTLNAPGSGLPVASVRAA